MQFIYFMLVIVGFADLYGNAANVASRNSMVSKDKLQTFVVDIEVSHKTHDSWEVTYQFSKPVSSVAFYRQTNKFRNKVWKISTPNIVLETNQNLQYVKSKSGNRFDQFTITHSIFTDSLPKDYELFQTFSDGGLILYTGHYNVGPMNDSLDQHEVDENYNVVTKFTFVPNTKEHIIVSGKFSKGIVNWVDNEDQVGTYVYFGNNEPSQSKYIMTLTDPEVPTWISEKIDNFLSKLIQYYGNKFGRPLDVRPIVYINWIDREKDYMGNAGGTLPSIIQLSMKGKRFEEESQKGIDWLTQFLAHEASHMWNGQMYTNEGSPWIHEGSADAFAYIALNELEINDATEFREKVNEAANRCALDLNGKSLDEARHYGWWHNYYNCGALIAFATEQATNSDLFTFWKKLFDIADTKGSRYTEEDYLSLLNTNESSKVLSTHINQILYTPQSDPGNFVSNMLRNAGFHVTPLDRYPDYFLKSLTKMIIRKIMTEDCGFADFGGNGTLIELNGSNECTVLKFSDTLLKIGQLDIYQKPVEAYELVSNACVDSKKLNLDFKSHKVKWKCKTGEQLPVRLKPLMLTVGKMKKGNSRPN